jgi:hypothetical protein
VGVVEVVRRVVVVMRRVEVGVGQARLLVRKTMSQPWYGQSAAQGAIRVAVGMAAGQLHGWRMVEKKAQSERGHRLLHSRFWMVRVAVGQATGAWAAARLTRLARPKMAVVNFMVIVGRMM